MSEDVDDLTRTVSRPPLPGVRGRRRWAAEAEEASESDHDNGMRCGWGRYDRQTGEHLDECGARACWRIDMICDLCGPRVGHACEPHRALVPGAIRRGWLRCHASTPNGQQCAGDLVEVIRTEWISR